MVFHFGVVGAGRPACGKRAHALHGLFFTQDAAQVTCKRCIARLAKLAAIRAARAGKAA